ncbi:cytochrome P450 [Nocardioides sp. AE5]|uniref:cytochrome P450 n=1 Tax=Nocardioides sp. AE5 TaxID=2962573 RepID=UPI0028811C69|nr:cytochrome P450 [Nocardioides sp. AE5]MDT0201964.1 cytochrome P450 [Nocardioides sp. AE5]
MRSTTFDFTSPAVIADPYPHFAAERELGEVAWHEPSRMFLTFSHAAASAVLRNRNLGRLWTDREPVAELEPFNMLHRNQMMENEPPVHTRLRRLVTKAFARGHVERLRPRVRELAAGLLAEVDRDDFDVIGQYAEPLPVLVIAELLGVPTSLVPELRDWSQAIVRMYEVDPDQAVVDAAVSAAVDFTAAVREIAKARETDPQPDLITDLVAARDGAARLSEDEVVASAVLLLNAGHEATVNVFGNGLVAMLERDIRPTADQVETCVEEMVRFDASAQLFVRTAITDVEVAGQPIAAGQRIAALLGAANRDPAVFERPDEFLVDRDDNPHIGFGAGLHFCLGAPLARMELVESVGFLFDQMPGLAFTADPVSRGTFVLRGYESVRVGQGAGEGMRL